MNTRVYQELLELSKNHVRTPEDVKAFGERIRLREIEFAKQSKLQTPTREWYEREYNI